MVDRDGYWDELEAELDRLSAENEPDEADPWAAAELSAPGLTPEQRAYLIDQPRRPRLSSTIPPPDPTQGEPSSDGSDPTGNAPGASEDDLA